MPTVSIITPVYNGERFIRESLDSALAQTYLDWELIAVDDGSTDSTPEILREYTDPRVRIIRQANQGEATARNTGLAQATGKYVAFLDADDLYLPNALADMVEYLEAHPEFDVVLCDGNLCDQNKRILSRLSEHRSSICTGDILEPLVLTADVITVPVCTMTRRATIEQYHVLFDKNLVIGPDWDFWIQLARHARFGHLDRITCMYRVHLTNITRTSGANRRKNDLIFGRMKVLNSDWFDQLSLPVRQQFFYNLLVELLADQPEKQEAILEHEQFKALPPREQAALWRQIGVDHLLRRSAPDFAVKCLETAVRIWPDDKKSRYTLMLVNLAGLSVAATGLRLWQGMHKLIARARSLGQRRPMPVPTSLGPVGS